MQKKLLVFEMLFFTLSFDEREILDVPFPLEGGAITAPVLFMPS